MFHGELLRPQKEREERDMQGEKGREQFKYLQITQGRGNAHIKQQQLRCIIHVSHDDGDVIAGKRVRKKVDKSVFSASLSHTLAFEIEKLSFVVVVGILSPALIFSPFPSPHVVYLGFFAGPPSAKNNTQRTDTNSVDEKLPSARLLLSF